MLMQRFGILEIPLKDVPRPVQSEDYPYIWKCGSYSLDSRDDANIEEVEQSIISLVGWLAFLRSGGLDGTETKS